MKFRMRKRKLATAMKDVPERPPDIITVAATHDHPYDEVNESRWALQKVFASHLHKISRQHLSDRSALGKRASLADASTSDDSSTEDKKEEKPVPLLDEDLPRKNQSFQLTCGEGRGVDDDEALNSVMETKVVVEQNIPIMSRDDGKPKKRLKCESIPSSFLECTSPRQDSSAGSPSGLPQCLASSEGCMTSFFPDSYNHHDLKPGDAAEIVRNGISETQNKISKFFLFPNAFFKKRPETKRNGIPKSITVVIRCKRNPVSDTKCCGALRLCDREEPVLMKPDLVETVTSFDTSLQRLEESLKKANLDADVEEQHSWPMHEPRLDARHQDKTAENTSATSSISTHSSLKFGKSIVKLPPVLSPPL